MTLSEEKLAKVLTMAAGDKKWVDELIEDDFQSYIFEVKSYNKSEDKQKEDLLTNKLNSRSNQITYDVFEKWTDVVKETAKIERNPQVLAR